MGYHSDGTHAYTGACAAPLQPQPEIGSTQMVTYPAAAPKLPSGWWCFFHNLWHVAAISQQVEPQEMRPRCTATLLTSDKVTHQAIKRIQQAGRLQIVPA